ncbi:cyclin-T1-5-like [Mangifera indica]|uniref:cyclin-T1-5-like n=1 Tax=Mangifera indica TaxID=29780 RepID=UPI001CF93951|nr:cyclin-T1-5-like [Mangifera indica]XP_044479795.1 cyclin-T1-5-like [Mangifera indica]
MASLLSGESSKISLDKPEEGGRWYFSREEIEENSPSRRDGIDWKKETYLRKSYCTFLQDLGMRLKVPQITIATAIIFCHRFFLRQSHARNDRRTIATVCMFLAGKVEETPRPLKDVIFVSYEIIHKKDKDLDAINRIKQKEIYEQQKELILIGERVVLSTLGFDLNVLHPYKPLVEAIKKFKVAQNALAQVAWNFVNDGLRTSLCLQFKPHHVAAGAIFLAAKFLKVKLPSDGERVWWQEFEVTPRQLEEVSNQMLELYEQNRVPPSQCGEVEGSAAAGSIQRASSRTLSSSEEYPTTNSYSQASCTTSRTLKPASIKPVSECSLADNHCGSSRITQNQINDWGNAEMENTVDDNACESKDDLHPEHDEFYYQNKGEAQSTLRFGADALGKEDQERTVVRNETRDAGELKEKHSSRKSEHRGGLVSQSPQEAIKKIDKDKVKAALEKRRNSRVDVTRKTDLMDDDDLIERELENGVELAAGNEKNKRNSRQSWSRRSDFSYAEDREVPVPHDLSHGSHSQKSSSRKRKVGSSPDRSSEGKLRHNYGSMSNHYNHHDYVEDQNRRGRLGYMERDQKRHVPENRV